MEPDITTHQSPTEDAAAQTPRDVAGGLVKSAQRAAPVLTRSFDRLGLVNRLEQVTAYLHLIAGQGSGAGWDSGEQVVATSLVRSVPDPVIVDVGANVGRWTIGLREALGHSRGRWLLLEPTPAYAERLRQITGAELIEAAAGEEEGEMTLYMPDPPSGWNTLHQRLDTFTRHTTFIEQAVKVVRLDDLLTAREVDHVDLMKLDVEGHELFVLRGLRRYLEERRIAAFTFEFGSANINSRTFFRDFWDLLTPLGYSISRIAPGGRLLPVKVYYETLEFFRGATNYVAMLR